jgi:hypothetical protein
MIAVMSAPQADQQAGVSASVASRRPAVDLILVGILAAAIYLPTISFDYAFDDMLLITRNRYTQAGLRGWAEILTHDSFAGFFEGPENYLPGGRYRPLAQLLFALEYQLWGLRPGVGHAINVACYLLQIGRAHV